MAVLTGNIDCEQKCEIPVGVSLSRVPAPRHAWSDIIRCPDCGDCFLITREGGPDPTPSTTSDGEKDG